MLACSPSIASWRIDLASPSAAPPPSRRSRSAAPRRVSVPRPLALLFPTAATAPPAPDEGEDDDEDEDDEDEDDEAGSKGTKIRGRLMNEDDDDKDEDDDDDEEDDDDASDDATAGSWWTWAWEAARQATAVSSGPSDGMHFW